MGVAVTEDDITHGLVSLQFQTNLNESELSLLHLRKRSFELLLHAASQSTYIVGMLNTITHHIVTGDMLRKGSLSKHRVNIGFVGGGRLSRHIISTLVHHGVCVPHDISVSTFQPEKLDDLAKTGVHVCCNNRLVVEQSDLVFVCVPSNQLVVLKRDVDLAPRHFLISYVSTLSKHQVAEELQHLNLLKTDYMYNKDAAYMHNEPYQSVGMTLEDELVVEKLFPGMECGFVHTSPDWVRDMILVFYRYILRIAPDGALNRLNAVLFGNNHGFYLQEKDFRVTGGSNRIASEPDQLNDIVGVGGKVSNLNAKISRKETLDILYTSFQSFFKPKSIDVSKYQ
ncbi:NADP-dependent oxidoreductase domain-containing protein 1-like [Bolinopsis microptera]|uniref:NADP-dependent oxidoreductase domain-containing protein 1-like n=1 Tax=Bolinopsis microptera TaxID=2820187 RepID=UPI00307AB525